ncbi:hypothetical protein [Shewanella sp. BC20]|uniref:hypothetical protein n=1 Tax=Shewanella sp. BC20 TaxID=2004459 RepID=UPI0015E7E7BD|nr:hypothetical protein [Shewanella sp. BC20]
MDTKMFATPSAGYRLNKMKKIDLVSTFYELGDTGCNLSKSKRLIVLELDLQGENV